MGYDINLVAQDDKYSSSYLPLIEKLKQRFPEFKNTYCDLDTLEKVYDGRYGTNNYTKQEIIQKGLSIKLEAEFSDGIPKPREIQKTASGFTVEIRHEDWMEISFWDNGNINLEVPNYPYRDLKVAIADILSVIQFFEKEGFAVDHPVEDKIILKTDVEAFLYQDYLNRQIQVDKVRKIVFDE